MTVIQIGCSQKGLANWVQQIVTGGIIVVAVALDRVRSARHEQRPRCAFRDPRSRSLRSPGRL